MGSLATSRYQRMRESAILGAQKRIVLRILMVEYVVIGSLATLAGLVLAIAAGWLVVVHVFTVPFVFDPLWIGAVWLGITALTLAVGVVGNRGVLLRPPLAVLRDVTS